MIILTAIQEIECWIDKYANWNTFLGLVVGILGIILAIYLHQKQRRRDKRKEETEASSQKELVELQNKALALQEEKLMCEVKPILYIEGILSSQIDRIVKVTIGNSNPKAHLHITKLLSITNGWQLVSKHIPDLQSNSVTTITLAYSDGKNNENFDVEFAAEDIYCNGYTLVIHSTYNSQLITLK